MNLLTPGVPGDLRERSGSRELRAGRMGWGRTRPIPCGSKSWQLFQTAAELCFSLLRPNFPWNVQEEPPKARDGAQGRVGTARGAGAAHLQHSWLSTLASAGGNVEINGFYLGSGCSTALMNEHPIFPKWGNPILEVSVHLLMALL